MIVKVNPPYKPLTEQPYCCGPCSFQWILLRRGYWIDQEEIAEYCKLKVPRKLKKLFVRNIKIAKSKKEEGTSVEKIHIYLKKLLKYKKIPLAVTKHTISKIKDSKKFIIENLKTGNDIMLDFACKPFPEYEFPHGGHVCVVVEFDTDKNILTLGDPAFYKPKFWKVPLQKIVKAMDSKWDGHERGFWIISELKR